MSNNIYLQYQNSVKSLGPFWALKKCKKAHFLYKKKNLKGPLSLSCILVIFESFSFFEIIKITGEFVPPGAFILRRRNQDHHSFLNCNIPARKGRFPAMRLLCAYTKSRNYRLM